jgi:hypothetical protein
MQKAFCKTKLWKRALARETLDRQNGRPIAGRACGAVREVLSVQIA